MEHAEKYTVPDTYERIRMDVCCHTLLPGQYSRSFIQSCIGNGIITRNGEPVRKNTIVCPGDEIYVDAAALADACDESIEPREMPLDILYEDEYVLVLSKPAGLAVHPHAGERHETLANGLLWYCGDTLSDLSGADRPGIVHRLDRNTSGILVAAKSNEVHRALKHNFKLRSVKKVYVAVCLGTPDTEEGEITHPIGRMSEHPTRRCVCADGRDAVTSYKKIAGNEGVTLLLCRIHTGRTHQIRVHCAHEGFPVAADKMYGGGGSRIGQLPEKVRAHARKILTVCPRLALHAYSLGFFHPVTQQWSVFSAPLPSDMQRAIATIEHTDATLRIEQGRLYAEGAQVYELM